MDCCRETYECSSKMRESEEESCEAVHKLRNGVQMKRDWKMKNNTMRCGDENN